MNRTLNFSVPQIMPIAAQTYNGFPTGILGSASFKRYWMGYSIASTAAYPADFIDLSADAFNFVQFKVKGYIGDTNLQQQIFTDKGQAKHPSLMWWFLVPIPIPLNTRALLTMTNLRATASNKTLVNFYLSSEVTRVV